MANVIRNFSPFVSLNVGNKQQVLDNQHLSHNRCVKTDVLIDVHCLHCNGNVLTWCLFLMTKMTTIDIRPVSCDIMEWWSKLSNMKWAQLNSSYTMLTSYCCRWRSLTMLTWFGWWWWRHSGSYVHARSHRLFITITLAHSIRHILGVCFETNCFTWCFWHCDLQTNERTNDDAN